MVPAPTCCPAGVRARSSWPWPKPSSRRLPHNSVLLAEAGTGTGKTLAYLIPALLSGGKVVISTGTKALQDQLFHRDLPAARRALKSPVKVALLKGRANYVCHHHLERNLADGRFANRDDPKWLAKIASFAETSSSGDRAEAEGIPEDATAWHYAVSSRDTCLGSECKPLQGLLRHGCAQGRARCRSGRGQPSPVLCRPVAQGRRRRRTAARVQHRRSSTKRINWPKPPRSSLAKPCPPRN